MELMFGVLLIFATLLCTLVTGLVAWFAIIVMPGIGKLEDRAFIRAFQVMDGVIQKNQPLFMIAWVGSVPALLAAAGLGLVYADNLNRALLIGSAVIYLLGVQAPTFVVNIPLNNTLQRLNTTSLTDADAANARGVFEGRWNRWNTTRSVLAVIVSTLLMVVLLRVTPGV